MTVKIRFLAAVLFLFYTASIDVMAQDESVPEMPGIGNVKDATDGLKSIAEDSGLPMPPGAIDGAKSTDLMYQVLRQIIGQPLANITLYTTNVDPTGNSQPVDNPTALVFMLSMMSGIGLLMTMVAALFVVAQSLVSVSTSAKLFNSNNGGGSPFAFLVSRTTISSLVNVPVPAAGGLALSQIFILFSALLGIGLGSATFSVIAERMLHAQLITYNSTKAQTFFVNSARAMLCLKTLTTSEVIPASENIISRRTTTNDDGDVSEQFWFGASGQCGIISYDYSKNTNDADTSAWGLSSLIFSSGDKINEDIEAIFNPGVIKAAQELLIGAGGTSSLSKAVDLVITDSQNLKGGQYVPSNAVINALGQSYSLFKAGIAKAVADLETKVNDCQKPLPSASASSTNLVCSNAIVRESIRRYGFMLAGTYSYVLNQRQSAISWAIEDSIPTFDFDFEERLADNGVFDDTDVYTTSMLQNVVMDKAFLHIIEAGTGSLAEDLNTVYEATTSDGAIAEALGDALYSSMRTIIKVGYLGKESSFQNPEPITQLATIGNTMMAIPFMIVAGDFALQFAKNINPVASGMSKVKDLTKKVPSMPNIESSILEKVFSMLLASALQALVVGGFFLSVFVPNIPYVMWNIAIFGYISYVLLAVIGVPIMIAAKPLNDGDGFIGGVKTGYMMAFTIFLRPVAMIIGLTSAMVLSRIFSWIINATYFESMQIASSGGYSMGAVIGVPFMYAVIQLTAIYKAYSMINEVPAFLGKMTETDRAHSDFGEEAERNRIGGAFINVGNTGFSAMGGRKGKPSMI